LKFDIRDLQIFVAVAEAGTIGRAAERCNTVASAVSKRLSELEQNFGVELLVRGAKGVELTSGGHALLMRARSLLSQAQQIDDEMRRHAAGARGYVRVFANISSIVEFLPGALASFSKQHPEIHVHLEEHVSSHIAAAVADGSADFGIVSELPAVIDGLKTAPFRSDELVLTLQAGHPLATRSSVTFAEVAELPFVGLHAESSLHHLLNRAAIEGGTTVNWRIHVTSFDAACAMVAAGLGVSVVPRAATTPYIKSLALAIVPLAETWAIRQQFLCSRSSTSLHPAARLLFEHLQLP
jgi:DNA-binding transcriptional LysR family regulator